LQLVEISWQTSRMSAPFQPIVIRASSLNYYADCPRRSATRIFWHDVKDAGYQLRQTAAGVAALMGTSLHAAGAWALGIKARGEDLPPEKMVGEFAVNDFGTALGNSSDVQWDDVTPRRDTAQRQMERQARSYITTIAPAIQPLMIETRLEATIAEDVVLSGMPDTICQERERVRDLKTGRRRSNCRPQLGAYSLLARSNGIVINELAEDTVPRTPLTKPQPDAQVFMHNIADAETAAARIIGMIQHDVQTFRHGDDERKIPAGDAWAFAANPNSMLCSDRFCPAHGTSFCKEWMSKEPA
jgi:hypothetical protein